MPMIGRTDGGYAARVRATAVVLAATAALGLAGCGGGGEATPTETIRVYRVHDGKLVVEAATVAAEPTPAAGALEELGLGDAAATVSDGVATLAGGADLPRERRAEVVYTLTQLPSIRAVEIGGERLTRADFEDLTPAILVETPLPGAGVRSPVHVAGTANTFEATLQVAIEDAGGKEAVHRVVTATSGNGIRGTFEVDVPTTLEGDATVVAYEISAEDGSVVNRVEVPVTIR
jgi:hypothetical protein